MAFTESLTHGL
uniref:Uncharacterized protein n=1 Tax=Anguilla anguilla TaxID=7936 RepID=A0A0E9XWI9_ANGAN